MRRMEWRSLSGPSPVSVASLHRDEVRDPVGVRWIVGVAGAILLAAAIGLRVDLARAEAAGPADRDRAIQGTEEVRPADPSDAAGRAEAPGAAPGLVSPREAEAVLYYFHRTLRCESCLTTEALLAETVRTYYAADLASGALLWLPKNLDDPDNARFEEQFALEYNTAVVVRMDGAAIVSWKHLDKLWEFLDQKDAFLAYTRMELAAALADSMSSDVE